jgi:hypothetical protein
MLIYVNITDRQTDGQTDRQTPQKYSSEPHKIKSWKHLPQVEDSSSMHFWPSWSKCWPGPHDTSVHLPFIDTDSIVKHCLYDWHLLSTGNLTLSVQFFDMGLKACRWPVLPNGHCRFSYSPFMQALYHSHSAVKGSLSPSMHS